LRLVKPRILRTWLLLRPLQCHILAVFSYVATNGAQQDTGHQYLYGVHHGTVHRCVIGKDGHTEVLTCSRSTTCNHQLNIKPTASLCKRDGVQWESHTRCSDNNGKCGIVVVGLARTERLKPISHSELQRGLAFQCMRSRSPMVTSLFIVPLQPADNDRMANKRSRHSLTDELKKGHKAAGMIFNGSPSDTTSILRVAHTVRIAEVLAVDVVAHGRAVKRGRTRDEGMDSSCALDVIRIKPSHPVRSVEAPSSLRSASGIAAANPSFENERLSKTLGLLSLHECHLTNAT
jgi:hypothetical protein